MSYLKNTGRTPYEISVEILENVFVKLFNWLLSNQLNFYKTVREIKVC